MDHNQSITQATPILLPLSFTNHQLKLTLPLPRTCHEIPLPFPPPRPFPSPEGKKISSQRNISGSEQRLPAETAREKKINNKLFTIEENYYSRKNQNLLSPRPPKYKPPIARPTSPINHEPINHSREKKVVFTEGLVREQRSTSSRRQSLTSKPIIRNIVPNGHHNQDNLSNSSRSLSAQNSFVSQFRSQPKRERTKVDNNKQRFTQIMSHFERNKEMREERNRNKFSRQSREKAIDKEEKYIDTIFPPVYTSLFINPNKTNKALGAEIKWKRLGDLYPAQQVCILPKEGISQVRVVLPPSSQSSDFVATAFNALKHCSCILEKIFEEQVFNRHGLYLVRIFQQHSWKSIILDEYIPVVSSVEGQGDSFKPVFIDVKTEQGNALELWPFLLEKAYANYYSAYELLQFGNTVDFISEIMGMRPLQIQLKKRSEKQYTNLQSSLQSVDSVAIGESFESKKQIIIRVRYSSESAQLVFSEAPSYLQQPLSHQLFSKLSKIFLFSPKIYHSLSTNTIGKYSPSHHDHDRAQYSIRKLILTQSSDCLISLQQKESRFFVKSSLNYQYMWMRVMLVQREYNGYRWIEGRYCNGKSVTLASSLAQGEYYLLIMPEWKQSQNFQLTLLVWANHHVTIEREKGSCEEMIEQACMDLAQRKGRINQLTSTLCSYNYLCPKTAMIIQNINNEKLKEEVRVHRDISGIPCSVRLLPVNRDFWPEKSKMVNEIDVAIPKLSSYTIVLKMRGGVDHKLIQLFASDREAKEKENNIK